MPVLPGLTGGNQGSAGALTDLLDGLTSEDLGQLVAAANDWMDAGEPVPVMAEQEDADVEDPNQAESVTDEPQNLDDRPDERGETLEDEASETPEEQDQEAEAGTEDLDSLVGQVNAAAESASAYRKQLDDILDQAKAAETEGSDPDEVEHCITTVEDLLDDIESELKDAEASAKDEDANGVAQAGLNIQKYVALIKHHVDMAQVYAEGNTPLPPEKSEDTPSPAPEDTPALALWAKKYGRTG